MDNKRNKKSGATGETAPNKNPYDEREQAIKKKGFQGVKKSVTPNKNDKSRKKTPKGIPQSKDMKKSKGDC